MKITPHQFFRDFFPDAYVCAMAENGGPQIEGRKIDSQTNLKDIIKIYQDLNILRYGIHFCPNGIKDPSLHNRLENLNPERINAWWIDIDIEETKDIAFPEDLIKREQKKEIIRGEVLFAPIVPSMTVESRNGFQLYWFVDEDGASHNTWVEIGNSIYQYFKKNGADKATILPTHTLRMPFFFHFKNGEQGKIEIIEALSNFKKHPEKEMLSSFPQFVSELPSLTTPRKIFKQTFKQIDDKDDIFSQVVKLPVDFVINKISEHWLVNGEKLTINKEDYKKANIRVDGKNTPNFIDREKNHIYSNNAAIKGPTVIQYLDWYWPNRRAMIAKGLKEIFNSSL